MALVTLADAMLGCLQAELPRQEVRITRLSRSRVVYELLGLGPLEVPLEAIHCHAGDLSSFSARVLRDIYTEMLQGDCEGEA